ncbi:hypothetical protein FQA39_LY05062 [Lamprigera yunnana]|nr:hypothetical protein FQA39_LY05062 [Lamprigera yunnana]
MDLIKNVSLLVLTPECFEEYFINLNFFDVSCFKFTLSKCLGVVLILGAVLVKVPQIIKIHNNKSGAGINISSVTLDLTAITIFMSYSFVKGFPFTAWGDSFFLALQTLIIAILVLYYGGSSLNAVVYLVGYLIVLFLMTSGMTPLGVLWTLQGFNIPILLMGKLTQAYTNFNNGNTGQLSAVTLIMLFGGSLARIFTSIQETGDSMVILTYTVSSTANFVLVYQLWYYWNVGDFSALQGVSAGFVEHYVHVVNDNNKAPEPASLQSAEKIWCKGNVLMLIDAYKEHEAQSATTIKKVVWQKNAILSEKASTSSGMTSKYTSGATSGNSSNLSDDSLSDFENDDSFEDKDYEVETSSTSKESVNSEINDRTLTPNVYSVYHICLFNTVCRFRQMHCECSPFLFNSLIYTRRQYKQIGQLVSDINEVAVNTPGKDNIRIPYPRHRYSGFLCCG